MTNLPTFTVLNHTTARHYAIALARSFGLLVCAIPARVNAEGVYEFALNDGSCAGVWFEFGRVYGEV